MVFFDVKGLKITADEFNNRFDSKLRFSVVGQTRLRAVTHLDVSTDQIKESIELILKEFG